MYYDTAHIELDRCYCLYCGEVCNEVRESEFGSRDVFYYYYCNCEGAKLDIEKQKLEYRLGIKIRENFRKIKKLEYEYKIKELKKEFKLWLDCEKKNDYDSGLGGKGVG